MWLDLRLRGLEPEKLRPDEKSLLLSHIARDRDMRYMETMLIVKTLVSCANAAAGKDPGSALNEMVKDFTDMFYPEHAYEQEDKMARIEALIKKEVARGPMKVQAQEYDKKRKKKKR